MTTAELPTHCRVCRIGCIAQIDEYIVPPLLRAIADSLVAMNVDRLKPAAWP